MFFEKCATTQVWHYSENRIILSPQLMTLCGDMGNLLVDCNLLVTLVVLIVLVLVLKSIGAKAPPLFDLYISDISKTRSQRFGYAYDWVLAMQHYSFEETEALLISELTSL